MNLILCLLLLTILAAPSSMAAQIREPDQQSSTGSQTSGPQQPVPLSDPHTAQAAERPVSWKRLLPNIASDQRRIWSFPTKLAHAEDWVPAAAVAGTTAALFAFDPIEAAYFRRNSSFDGFNHVFTGNATVVGTIAAPIRYTRPGLSGRTRKCSALPCWRAKLWPMPKS